MKKIADFLKKNSKKSLIPIAAVAAAVILLTALVSTKRKTITLIIDGYKKNIVTYKSTVGQVLESNNINIGRKDKLTPSINTNLGKNDTITLKRAINVSICIEGKVVNILSSEDSVASMLKAEKIQYDSNDKITPKLDTPLNKNLKVDIVKVDTKTLTENFPIQFKTTVKYDRSLLNTQQKVVQQGKNGTKQITVSVTYENGKEVSREIDNQTIIKKPVDKIIAQGTYPYRPVSRGGRALPYSKIFTSKTTAYWAVGGVGTTYTASGRRAVRNSDGFSTVAVDPRVIPFGTRIFIQGYGFAIAADTGTAIKGNRIDVYFNTYDEACDWGAKYVNVYVLK